MSLDESRRRRGDSIFRGLRPAPARSVARRNLRVARRGGAAIHQRAIRVSTAPAGARDNSPILRGVRRDETAPSEERRDETAPSEETRRGAATTAPPPCRRGPRAADRAPCGPRSRTCAFVLACTTSYRGRRPRPRRIKPERASSLRALRSGVVPAEVRQRIIGAELVHALLRHLLLGVEAQAPHRARAAAGLERVR